MSDELLAALDYAAEYITDIGTDSDGMDPEADRVLAALATVRAALAAPEPTPGLRAGLLEAIEALSWIDENAVSEDRRAILLADLWPLLATSPAPEPTGLDAAWAEAEAALPEGWEMGSLVATIGLDGGIGSTVGWRATAYAIYEGFGKSIREDAEGLGTTPAAALRALAARLGLLEMANR